VALVSDVVMKLHCHPINVTFSIVKKRSHKTNVATLLVRAVSTTGDEAILKQLERRSTEILDYLESTEGKRLDKILGQSSVDPVWIARIYQSISSGEKELITDDPLIIDDGDDRIEIPTVLGPDGQVLEPDGASYKSIISDLTEVSQTLLKELAESPEELRRVSPRFFEKIVAEIFRRMNYKVLLTQSTRDGGKDIYAVGNNGIGSFMYIIECKKHSPSNPVGVGIVRSLYGVVEAERATAGIVATTSFFTKDAKEFESKVRYRMELKDFLDIKKWLIEVAK